MITEALGVARSETSSWPSCLSVARMSTSTVCVPGARPSSTHSASPFDCARSTVTPVFGSTTGTACPNATDGVDFTARSADGTLILRVAPMSSSRAAEPVGAPLVTVRATAKN